MTIKIPTTANKNKWTAFHSEWGVASGRLSTLLWNDKQEVEEWIKENQPYTGTYYPIPWVLPQDLIGAEILEF
jgi:hypothetical protein